jgi:hypothetical protein
MRSHEPERKQAFWNAKYRAIPDNREQFLADFVPVIEILDQNLARLFPFRKLSSNSPQNCLNCRKY